MIPTDEKTIERLYRGSVTLYRSYATDADWSYWALSETDALVPLVNEDHAVSPLTLRERDGKFAYYEDADGCEFCVDEIEVPTTPDALVKFLNEMEG